MYINDNLKDFIAQFQNQINNNEWDKIYSSYSYISGLNLDDNGKFTEILLAAQINPLYMLNHVPKYFLAKSSLTGPFIIPDNIEEIQASAFATSSFDKIILSKNLTSIGDGAFGGCLNLQEVVMYPKVNYIGTVAFKSCPRDFSIDFKGTKEQWNNIDKREDWKDNSWTTVHCTDGDIQV